LFPGIGLAVLLGVVVVALAVMRAPQVTVRVKTNVSFRDLRELSRSLDQRLAEYMRANYSGDPAQLESAIRGLLPLARGLAQEQGQSLDDDLLRLLIVAGVAGHRFANRAEVESAVAAALAAERKAA
jgi:hypothetical protein